MTDQERLSKTQIAAFLHDPIEKALILMRTREGHERGTSEALRQALGLSPLPGDIAKAVKRADRWASGADRAVFPKEVDGDRWPAWQQVRFTEEPVVIHPLTGNGSDLKKLRDIGPDEVKAIAQAHLEGLIHRNGEAIDYRRTALAFWRFGPEERESGLKNLWPQLPADSRVPDHTIFDHLDLAQALAPCLLDESQGGPAHLVVSLGPVQPFIASARTTSDLWAGSHLLACLSWEAMKVVCERLGPASILFPRLRGVPLVDLWLREEAGLAPELFEGADWTRRISDANPLFAAALPNRFTALVPAAQAREIAEAITERVRTWVKEKAEAAYGRLLDAVGIEDRPDLPGHRQIEEQLRGFPEVQWVAVPWSLADTDAEGWIEGTERLKRAMAPFFESDPPGFLGSDVWQIMEKVLRQERDDFWTPNPGMLYPAWFDLAERNLAATKALRPFDQLVQEGWRDTLSGENEWLTTDRAELAIYSPEGSLWERVAEHKPRWVKEGERLSALGTLKRLWPTLFRDELADALDVDFSRFVVSTHTMAIAGSLVRALEKELDIPDELRRKLDAYLGERLPLPRRLAEALRDHPDADFYKAIPAWLDDLNEKDDQGQRQEAERHRAERLLKDWLGTAPEKYYALLLMDGDKMGAWLSADPDVVKKRYEESFHPKVRAGLKEASPELRKYAEAPRAPTPAWHMAISEALNHFSIELAPVAIEKSHNGRVLYAGGDDLMAMLPVGDLLTAMGLARAVYSGIDPAEVGVDEVRLDDYARQDNGFVLYRNRLLRLMGDKATASCGAVVAHHKAPLGAVLRELRAAEARAKKQGGRDAFSITVVKRGGGALRLTAHWGEPLRLLIRLRDFLAEPATSRRAVYNVLRWLPDMPEPEDPASQAMLAELLAYQFQRQCGKKAVRDHHDLPGLAARLAEQARAHTKKTETGEGGTGTRRHEPAKAWLTDFLGVAEFLAREGRTGEIQEKNNAKPQPAQEAQS